MTARLQRHGTGRTDASILQCDRRQRPEGEPAVEVHCAEEAAGDEAGKHRQRKALPMPAL